MEEKKQLRQYMKQQLSVIGRPQYEQMSYQIAQYLYNDSFFQDASHIGITISNIPEVDTYQIIRTCWEQGKVVSVPKCLPKQRDMDFRVLNRFDQLESTYSNLFEPILHNTLSTDITQLDLLIVPGLIYAPNGSRIGFGGGYYDRYLKNYLGNTISLAFSAQIIEEIPSEEHDIRVQKIITNKGVIRVK